MAFELKDKIAPVDPLIRPGFQAAAAAVNPLGLLAALPGKWVGKGFNQIWRPFHGTSDCFLELNLTKETLEFSQSVGAIPNRGLLQPDIELAGIHDLQQVKDVLAGVGIHVEPGFWVTAPLTTNPAEPATVARMASIPHGTTVNAQGTAIAVSGGPIIDPVSIRPFPIGSAPPRQSRPSRSLPSMKPICLSPRPSGCRTLSRRASRRRWSITRTPAPTAAIAGQTITHTTVLTIGTKAPAAPPPPAAPNVGGGTNNTAFLQGGPAGPNADAQMTAIFWIEQVAAGPYGPAFLQLQYTQTVLLNFNRLSWPHVSVATLRKQ